MRSDCIPMSVEHTIDIPERRFIVIHYHIFKNGGTTIESILRREFSGRFATVHGPSDDSVLYGEDLAEFLRQHPNVSAVSSHHLRYPKPVVPGWVMFDCCFLRHPLLRLVSLYHHFRRTNSSNPLCHRARSEAPREFMEQVLCDSPNMVSNVQVTQLASAGAFTRPANDRDLERANQVFCDMAVPGIVELFTESLAAAEYFLRPAFPTLRLHHIPLNVSPSVRTHPRDGAHQMEETLIDLWGENLYSALQRRISLLPDLHERLVEFKARCTPSRREVSSEMMERERVQGRVEVGQTR